MRGVLFLLVLVGGIYLGASFFGGSSDPNEASADSGGGAAQADGDSTPESSAVVDLPADGAGESSGAESGGAPSSPSGPIVDVVRRVAEGLDVDPSEPALKALLEADPRGAMVRNAISAEPASRWLGLSGLYRNEANAASKSGLLAKVTEAAKDGARSASLSQEYVVVGGDSLSRISDRMKKKGILTTPGILRWANGISGDRIFPKQRLRVPTGPVRITVSKESFHLRLWLGEGLVLEYPVGLGKEGKTPVDDFVIDSRLIEPPWPNPETGKVLNPGDPGYAIGTRWLGFDDDGPNKGFGIHGTDEPSSIGKEESLGCVRLRNADVEELFEFVPRGAEVSIR